MAEDNGRNRSVLAAAVAAQIRAERAASGKTQRQVIEASGLPKSTYLRLESGDRVADVTQLGMFCRAIGVSLTEFMRRAEERAALPPTLAGHITGKLSDDAQEQIRRAREEKETEEGNEQDPNG